MPTRLTIINQRQSATKLIVLCCGCICLSLLAIVGFGRFQRSDAAANPPRDRQVSASPAGIRAKLVASYGKLPLSFETNQGQVDHVRFMARGASCTVFLADNEAVLTLRKSPHGTSPFTKVRFPGRLSGPVDPRAADWPSPAHGLESLWRGLIPNLSPIVPHPIASKGGAEGTLNSQLSQVVRMRLVGSNARGRVVGLDDLPGRSSYLLGNDPTKWRTNVHTYARVRYQSVYHGIDLVYYGNQSGQLEYDFVVTPGADPSSILLAIDAAGGVVSSEKAVDTVEPKIDSSGDLVVHRNGHDEVRFHKPVVYQEQRTMANGKWSGPEDDRQFVDGHFVLLADNRIGFAVPVYDRTRPLVIDPVLVYSTYLGGSDNDYGYGIAVDSSGNAYVTGQTNSINFPTVNPIQASLGGPGASNAFVAKLNPTGSALVYSTYLGGNTFDQATGIAVDSSGNAYVTGCTYSTNFPTVNPIQASFGGSGTAANAFVAELNAAGSALVYSTYLGGSGSGYGFGIAVDSFGNAYVTGHTGSTDFPTVNPVQASLGGPYTENAFVAKLNPTGLALVYSTYLGGGGGELAFGIAVDSSRNAYVTGWTKSYDFPTANPVQASLEGANNAFVAKIAGSPAPGPGVTLSTHSLNLGNELQGATSSLQSVTLRSIGTDSLTITNITISGDYAFAPTSTSCPYTGGTVDSGTNCTIDVTFTPTGTGTHTGSVTINDNASDSPQSVSLTGTGVASASVAAVSPAALTFGPQWADSSSTPQPVTLSNVGNATLTISSIGVSGNFSQTNNCGSSVAAGGFCTINVTLAPGNGGPLTGVLTITDNSNNTTGSTQTVSLSGTGQDFTMTVVIGPSTSFTISPGQSVSYTWTVAAQGGFIHAVNFSCSINAPEASCTVSPKVLTPSSAPTNFTVTVTTTAPSASALRTFPPLQPRLPQPKVVLMLATLLAGAAWKARRRNQVGGGCRLWTGQVSFAAGLLLVLALAGCGGGSGGGSDAAKPGTPPGSYTMMTTGTASSGSSSISQSWSTGLTVF